MTTLELLSPAGGPDALNAAVRGGADAVYVGLGAFNARRNADNFDKDTLKDACDYAHLRGTKVYVALNTVVLPDEVDAVLACADDAYVAGADALIVQDIGIARRLSDAFPACSVHLSTQANIHDSWGIEAAALVGVERVTLARELSMEEIARLSKLAAQHHMQTEVFVHGALCVCYSGQCLMSSMIGQRSANRGLCAQACRLPYALVCEEEDAPNAPGEFLLSPKDLCGVDLIPELVDAGVTSFKIEGRMKSPEYVHAVTSVYRRALDALMEGDPGVDDNDRAMLASVFTRGFTTAYLQHDRSNAIMSYQRPNNRGVFIGRVKAIGDGIASIVCEEPLVAGDIVEFWTSKGRAAQQIPEGFSMEGRVARIALDAKVRSVRAADRVFRVRSAQAAFTSDPFQPRIPLDGAVRALLDQPLEMTFEVPQASAADGTPVEDAVVRRLQHQLPADRLRCVAQGDPVQSARSKELTAEDVRQHVGRMGQTPFRLASCAVDLDGGVGMGFSTLHHLRADALDELRESILLDHHVRPPRQVSRAIPEATRPTSDPVVCALTTNPDCARAAKRAGAADVYVPALDYRRGQATMEGALQASVSQASYPHGCIMQMPAITHDATGASREAALGCDPWEYAQPGKPLLVESLGGLVHAAALEAAPEVGAELPLTNALSIQMAAALGATRAWLSPELNIHQIERLAAASPLPLGIKVSGALQLMVTEHCPLMSLGPCDQRCTACTRRMSKSHLRDRKEYRFPVVTDALGRGHIFNSVPLDAVPALPHLLDAGVTAFMVDATLLDPERTAQAVGRAVHALQSAREGRPAEPKLPNTTSGHLFRGVV